MKWLLCFRLLFLSRTAYTLWRSCGYCQGECQWSINGYYCREGCVEGYYGRQCLHACPNECQTCHNFEACPSCKNGYWGPACKNQCDIGCNSCFKAASSCYFDCKESFFGSNCQPCPINCTSCNSAASCSSCKQGYWGVTCQIKCPLNCIICDSDSFCPYCNSGYYGNTCNYVCPRNCKGRTCNKITGACLSCNNGYHGDYCNYPCPSRCSDKNCRSDGTCFSCDNGFYGQRCTKTCPTNCNGGCNILNGACGNCVSGYFGVNCARECPENCASCNSETTCSSCVTGYTGYLCQENCSYCKEGTQCGQWNGKCSECRSGLYGSFCTQTCPFPCKSCIINNEHICTECLDGTYGKHWSELNSFCSQNCSNSCLNNTCDNITGHCDHGCENGNWGDTCIYRCSKNCKNNLCSRNNGDCIYGCVEGYTGPQCTCPINCECNGDGICYKCKDNFENISRNCTCSSDISVCSTEVCSSCSLADFYSENAACCPCSKNCRNNACESASKCSSGCKEGFRGDGCSNNCNDIELKCSDCTIDYEFNKGKCLKCIAGHYPSNGSRHCLSCSSECINETCNGKNGKCTFGCKEGRWGTICERHCSENCLRCSQTNGTCLVCKSGKYMSDCSKPCSTDCSDVICAIENGACLNGCDSPAKYGIYCENKCNSNCMNNTCDWKTGVCVQGCFFNHYGKHCTNECDVNCKEVDGASPCNQSTGFCATGCKDGYYGNFCDQTCSSNCLNITCRRISGSCILGCTHGYTGSNCMQEALKGSEKDMKIGLAVGAIVLVIIIIGVTSAFCIIRRRNKRRKSESNRRNDNNLQNTTVSYSEVRASRIEIEETDAVYAKPNKPKKKTTDETMMIPKSNNSLETVKTENDERKTVPKAKTKINNETILPDCKNTPEKEGAVYENTKIGESLMKAAKAENELKQGLSSVFEVEEDLSNITALANHMDLIKNEYHRKENEGDYAYYNLADLKKRKVSLEKLAEYVSKKTKKDFIEEFDKLPEGLIKPFTESQKAENLTKNRYRALYPYDKTRVILKGRGSDYINASFIDGYKKLKAYIASIGPTTRYMGDMSPFWRMVWQEKVGKIVMLTKLSEAGTPKCDQYWPEKDCHVIYDDIQVTFDHEEIYSDYTVRCFTVRKDSVARKIVQLHFMAWPDKGIPDDVTNLIEFRHKVNNICTDLDGPIVVHCSAGVGRTGTYIAIDSTTQEGEAEGGVDIYACVRNLREQRVNMEQYQFLHNAVVHILTFDCKPVKASMFHEYMSTCTTDQLGCQFKRLHASVKRSDDEMEAVRMNNTLKDKNRIGADIPGENNRPRIFLRRAHTMSGYINALYINGFRTVNRFLVAQTPLPNTVEDFLALIVQEKVSCVVAMDTSVNENKTVGSYYPVDKQTLSIGSVTVQTEDEKSMEQYVQRKLKISHQGKSVKEEVKVTHIQYTKWMAKQKVPDDPKMFMQFVKDVETICDGTSNKGPILVHCLTAAEKSGLFCVVSILLEKTLANQEVSVVNTVCKVKNRRHKSILNKEQYIFCHQCLDEYLHTFDTYSNFCLEQ